MFLNLEKWSFRSTRKMGTLASQAEICVIPLVSRSRHLRSFCEIREVSPTEKIVKCWYPLFLFQWACY